jgi:hypothetical protein
MEKQKRPSSPEADNKQIVAIYKVLKAAASDEVEWEKALDDTADYVRRAGCKVPDSVKMFLATHHQPDDLTLELSVCRPGYVLVRQTRLVPGCKKSVVIEVPIQGSGLPGHPETFATRTVFACLEKGLVEVEEWVCVPRLSIAWNRFNTPILVE